MKKFLIILIKYMPIIQMIGMLLNNILYYFDINNKFSYIFDFTIGNSIITTILLYVCSYIFNFCIWHRLIITANIINIFIAFIDIIFILNITDIQLLIVYHIVYIIFILISTYLHIKKKL